jgi:hypothetical protein
LGFRTLVLAQYLRPNSNPAGVNEKLKSTQQYLQRRIVEFEDLQKEIELLKRDVQNNG